jgi:mRNA-degrading endonuclease RelE of RelBE toxin-antitoxin system
LSLYSIEFDPRGLDEASQLPARLRRRLKEDLGYLRAGPFRSHPGVRVKELRDLRGVWRFHLDRRWRVFYVTIEDRLVVVFVDRGPGVTPRTTAELRRRLR